MTWELSENVNTRLFPGPIHLDSQMGNWACRLSLKAPRRLECPARAENRWTK